MSQNFIKCRKYHSAIPQNYSDCDVIMRYEPLEDTLKIYEITGMSDTLFQRSVNALEELKYSLTKKKSE